MTDLKLDATKVMKSASVNIKVVRMPEFRARLWLGMLLVRLGFWIIGCNVEIET